MTYTYQNKGTCSRSTTITVEDGVIQKILFKDGCEGNLSGISKLCVGRTPAEIIERLEGTCCGFKKTSCPDQLAQALRAMLAQQ